MSRDISAHIDAVAQKAAEVSENVGHLSQTSAQACCGTARVIWSAVTLTKVASAYVCKVR